MYGRKLYLALFSIMVLTGLSYSEPSVMLSPSVVWLNDNSINVKIDLLCPQNYSYESVYGILEDNNGGFINLNNFILSGDNKYSMNINDMYIRSGYGTYKITGICKVNDSRLFSTYSFLEVNKLVMDISSPTKDNVEELYTDNYINIRFSVKLNDHDVLSNELYNIKAYLVDHVSKIKYPLSDMVVGTENNEVTVTSRIPEDIEPSLYDIEVSADYSYKGEVRTINDISYSSILIKYPLEMKIISPKTNEIYKVLRQKNELIYLDITEKNQPILNISQTNFDVYLIHANTKIPVIINNLTYDEYKDLYKLNITIIAPVDVDDTVYDLNIILQNIKNYRDVKDDSLKYIFLIPFSGNLSDIKKLKLRMTFKNDKIFDTLTIGNNYDLGIIKGVYDINIQFPDLSRIEFKDVNIDSPTYNAMRYYSTSRYDALDLKILKLFVFEFGLPFKDAKLYLKYDDSKSRNEKNLIVYYCDNWNYGRKECAGEWQKTNYEINTVTNLIKLNYKLGAYIIGEEEQLYIDGDLDKHNFYVGDLVKYVGVVRNSKGEPLSDVEVYYDVADTNIHGSVKSDIKGEFTISFNAPKGASKITAFTLNLSSKKPGYKSFSKQIHFTSERKVSLAASMPDVVQGGVDKDIDVLIRLSNDGQVDLKNIEFKVSGIKEGWYTIIPSFIESLNEGETTDVHFKIRIPSSECDKDCKNYYFVQILVKSEEISEDLSFTLKMFEDETNTTSIPQNADKDTSSFKLTGMFSSLNIDTQNENKNIYLIFFFIALGYAVITFKKFRNKNFKQRTKVLPKLRKKI